MSDQSHKVLTLRISHERHKEIRMASGRLGISANQFLADAAEEHLKRMNGFLNLDVSAEEARALHRIVRAMHDGHCPKCGHLGPSSSFRLGNRHECPICRFIIRDEEAEEALRLFRPYLRASLEVFERWRTGGDQEQQYSEPLPPDPQPRHGIS